ncbi:universal stress protein [Phenylobacterium sp. J367]|uniref:universal stress protein n=1 Tax=Phenylobacterium sp. J367 TaxID=2898435 RepID=UPI002151597D|nr:universal stress protein [Phenylobacterium sp. J367]MCR5879278.1 universal stress protein [Phenylobacterium sp. J367]
MALEADIKVPRNRLANALIGLDAMAREAEERSAQDAGHAVQAFVSASARAGLLANAIFEKVPTYLQADDLVAHARTRDLSLIPIGPQMLADVGVAEALLFGSGRPVCIFPEGRAFEPAAQFDKAAIAWDGSRVAARAVADALPVLQAARAVRILVVRGEKALPAALGTGELQRHLRLHDIETWVNEIDAGGEPIGRAIASYVQDRDVDLLVMGGFGHSRAREFVLGGATAAMFEAPPCPAFLSH